MIELYEFVLDCDDLMGPGWLKVSEAEIVHYFESDNLEALAIEPSVDKW